MTNTNTSLDQWTAAVDPADPNKITLNASDPESNPIVLSSFSSTFSTPIGGIENDPNLTITQTVAETIPAVFDSSLSFDINAGDTDADLTNASSINTKKIDFSLETQIGDTYSFSALVTFKDIEPDQVESVFEANKASLFQKFIVDDFSSNDIYDIELLQNFDESVVNIFSSQLIEN